MRDFITADREANAIRLRRSAFKGTFLLVEGSSDKVFYQRFVDSNKCELISVSGKPSSKLRVIKVLEILEISNFAGIMAIIDADFDYLENSLRNNPNLFYTDTHDLETTLIKSPALDKVISEFGSERKISKFNQDIRTVLLDAGILIGYLRWISQTDGLGLKFSNIIFSKFINEKTLQIDKLKLIKEVKNKSQAFILTDENLNQRLIDKQNNSHDPWQVCCGHDLVEILSIGLRKAIGSNKVSDVEPESLERNLRLAYEQVYFTDTQLYLSIQNWENKNQSFKVFPSNI